MEKLFFHDIPRFIRLSLDGLVDEINFMYLPDMELLDQAHFLATARLVLTAKFEWSMDESFINRMARAFFKEELKKFKDVLDKVKSILNKMGFIMDYAIFDFPEILLHSFRKVKNVKTFLKRLLSREKLVGVGFLLCILVIDKEWCDIEKVKDYLKSKFEEDLVMIKKWHIEDVDWNGSDLFAFKVLEKDVNFDLINDKIVML